MNFRYPFLDYSNSKTASHRHFIAIIKGDKVHFKAKMGVYFPFGSFN